jgi:hypothetical protein
LTAWSTKFSGSVESELLVSSASDTKFGPAGFASTVSTTLPDVGGRNTKFSVSFSFSRLACNLTGTTVVREDRRPGLSDAVHRHVQQAVDHHRVARRELQAELHAHERDLPPTSVVLPS